MRGGHQSLSLKATKIQNASNSSFSTLDSNRKQTTGTDASKTSVFGEQLESTVYFPRADPIKLPHPLRSVSIVSSNRRNRLDGQQLHCQNGMI